MLLRGLVSLASVTIANVPINALVHSEPDKFLGDNLKGFSLSMVA
jgi:hypothetical protein